MRHGEKNNNVKTYAPVWFNTFIPHQVYQAQ
jgi:hypothetical protein